MYDAEPPLLVWERLSIITNKVVRVGIFHIGPHYSLTVGVGVFKEKHMGKNTNVKSLISSDAKMMQ